MTKNHVEIKGSECKGCGVCVEACPRQCLEMGTEINDQGYAYAKFAHEKCIACGMCFYSCPEPGAITVHKAEKK